MPGMKFALAFLAFALAGCARDSRDSTIAWEGMQEMRHAHDTLTEEPIMQRTVLERTARDLIARLP